MKTINYAFDTRLQAYAFMCSCNNNDIEVEYPEQKGNYYIVKIDIEKTELADKLASDGYWY